MIEKLEPYFRWTRGRHGLWRVHHYLRAAKAAARVRAVEAELAGATGLVFTADYFSEHTARWGEMLAHLRGQPDLQVLEIGSYEGRSAVWLLENLVTGTGACLTCLDLFGDVALDRRFDHNMRVAGAGPRVRKLKGRSEDVLIGLPSASYDLIYVDGAHDAPRVLFDGLQSWRLLKPGGTLIFDDYDWGRELSPGDRPRPAIDLMLDTLGPAAEVLWRVRQVVLRKPA